MPRNVEIKARIDSVETLLSRAQALAEGPPQRIDQDDTFFTCAHGRLKLRDFGDGSGELIHYQRADDGGPKLSDYVRAPTSDAAAMREALSRAHALIGRVRKTRLLLWVGQTRVHLDRVEGLGDFMELEVVLRPAQTVEEGIMIAQALRARLGVPSAQCLAGAYLDLLLATSSTAGMAAARKS